MLSDCQNLNRLTGNRGRLHSAHWLVSSLKLAARCPVSGCWPSCTLRCYHLSFAFSASTLLVDSQEEHLAHVVRPVCLERGTKSFVQLIPLLRCNPGRFTLFGAAGIPRLSWKSGC